MRLSLVMKGCFLWAMLAGFTIVDAAEQKAAKEAVRKAGISLPNVTIAGYLNVNKEDGSKLFYTYYEAQTSGSTDPIILWLQGGPGCAGNFGNFYELGPEWVEADLTLKPNPGAWNRLAGLLFIDQPVGTGFSLSGSGRVPANEEEVAADLYVALQDFFKAQPQLASRPLFITGESYAGKYVPAIGHFVLNMERAHGLRPDVDHNAQDWALDASVAARFGRPRFKMAGLAIGNGLTDPAVQVKEAAATLYYTGLIDTQQYWHAIKMQEDVERAIKEERWGAADVERDNMLGYLKNCTGVGTMLDYRRTEDYDSGALVDRFLNQPKVQEFLGIPNNTTYVSCSDKVSKVLSPDAMKSVKYFIPDLLRHYPLLLYQGAFDAQDGPATQEAWIHNLDWVGQKAFADSSRHVWRAHADGSVPRILKHSQEASLLGERVLPGRVLGYWRQWGPLTHIIVRDAGHMVPRDDPITAQVMIESWIYDALMEVATRQSIQTTVE